VTASLPPELARHEALEGRVDEVEAYLRRAADPDAVCVGLQRLLEAGADPTPALDGWLALLDAAPASVETLVTRPSLVHEVPRHGETFDRDAFARALDAALHDLPDLDARLDHLRRVRVEETLRIAWQDVVEGADLTVVTRRISDLADLMVDRVLREMTEALTARFGRPWHGSEPVGAAVIAMGKLGGAELNYSSDIDLVFLYGKDGETDGAPGKRLSNHEFFHRLTERVTNAMNAVTSAGRLYRVDLRLRPEGVVGSLARSLASTVSYYLRTGETWERQAFLKARVIAGDRRIGDEFVTTVKDWAYGPGLTFDEIASLKRLKQRIEDRTAGRGAERTEVKTGYGGIRDVEYVIQFLQLLHGNAMPQVRHHNSLAALRLLEKVGAILPAERDVLDDAYRFLRLVEHRLMLVQGAQVHRLPEDRAQLGALARRCGLRNADDFEEAYRERAEAVRGLFDKLFRQAFADREAHEVEETNLVLSPDTDHERLAEVLARHGLRAPGEGVSVVEELCRETASWLEGSPRTRNVFADLFPRLLDALAKTPDPDAALRRLERVTARVGARATLYEALAADAELLHVLVDLAGQSRFLCNILERTPGTLDQLVDALKTETGRGLASFEDIPTATVPTATDPSAILSDYKNLELLRIGLRDVRGQQTTRETGEDLTRLAEICVRLGYERARREARRPGAHLVVVGLGKLGASELLYGSDLDLFFVAPEPERVADATAVARRLTTLLDTPTGHGRLYEVDLRLRPGGKGGPLVTTPGELRHYFGDGPGQTWERMAYTRARCIAGPPTFAEEAGAALREAVFAPGFGPREAAEIADMRERLAEDRPASVKRGREGGVVDVEFVTQMYALERGRDDERYREGNVRAVLKLLQETGGREAQLAADLNLAYGYLMTLESKLRIVADLPQDTLPEEQEELHALARRLGYVDTDTMSAADALREEYDYHRDVAARAFRAEVEARRSGPRS